MLHRMHDSVRAQRLGSWTWAVVLIAAQVADIGGLVVGDSMSRSASCEAAQVMAMVQAIATCVVNGTHGMRFSLKGGLVAFLGLRGLIETAICPLVAVALAPVALIASAILIQMAELYLRRSYAKQYCLLEDKRRLEERLKEKLRERLEERLEKRLDDLRVKPLLEDKRRLEERNEQLQAEKERLLYDVHRRGRPLDNDDERSVIRRGLQAGTNHPATQAYLPRRPGSASSEAGLSEPELMEAAYAVEAEQKRASAVGPASLRGLLPVPPSLPPGPPSSTTSESTAPPYPWAGADRHHTENKAATAPKGKRVLTESAGGCPMCCEHWRHPGLVSPTPSLALAAPPPSSTPKASQGQQVRRFATSVKRGRAALDTPSRLASAASPAGMERVDPVELAAMIELPDEEVVTALQRGPSPVSSTNPAPKPLCRPMPAYAIQNMAFPVEVTQQPIASLRYGVYLPGAPPCTYLPEVSAVGALSGLTLQEKFHTHVMCNYTPVHPSKLPRLQWVSCE
jgi:hypothetical protein